MRHRLALLVLCLSLLWASSAHASWTLIASTKTSVAASPGITTTGANLLVVIQTGNNGNTPTDSLGNMWTAGPVVAGSFTSFTKLWFVFGTPSVGAGHTFTPGGGLGGLVVEAWSGALTTNPLVQQAAGATTGGATTIQPGSLTPGANGALVIQGVGGGIDSSTTINGSYTLDQVEAGIGGVSYGTAIASWVQTTATATNPTWTDASTYMNALGVSFTVAAGGGGCTAKPTLALLGVGNCGG